jgi:exosome complex component RRP42
MAALLGNASTDRSHILEQLCIVEARQCWELYVDALVLERGGGNLFDAVGLAVRAALATTKIPRVDLVEGDVPGVMELEVSDDPEQCRTFDCAGVPVCVTLTRVGTAFVVDATDLEERCSGARLVVGVSPKGTVCGLQKAGKSGLPPSVLPDMVHVAQKTGLALIAKLNAALKFEAEQTRPPIGFF